MSHERHPPGHTKAYPYIQSLRAQQAIDRNRHERESTVLDGQPARRRIADLARDWLILSRVLRTGTASLCYAAYAPISQRRLNMVPTML